MYNSASGCDPVEGSISEKRSRTRSEVWDHFEKTADHKRATCKYCSTSLGAESKAGTTHLKRHLEKCKKRRQDIDQPLTNMGVRGDVRKLGQTMTMEKTWDVEVKKAILGEVPFAPPDCKKALSSLMGLMDMDKEICSYYEHEKEKLTNQFKDLTSQVCFSYEIIKELKYISITAHFINDNFNLVKKLIAFKKLTDISSMSCVVHTIKECISDWKLGDKIFSITGKDYSQDVGQSLRKDFPPKISFEGLYFHVPCYKKGFGIFYSNYIGAVYFKENANIDNFIKAVKAVHCQMESFNQIAKERDLPPINEDWLNQYADSSWDLDCEDPKHWEPAVKMFKEVIPYKDVFSEYAKINSGMLAKGHEGCLELENWSCNGLDNANLSTLCTSTELSTSFLSDIDWERVEAAVKLSDKVPEVINSMASFNYPTSNLYFQNLAKIEGIMWNKVNFPITIKNINETNYYYLRYAIRHSISFFQVNKVFFVACALDPRYKLFFFKYLVEQIMGPESREKYMNEIREFLQEIFGAYVNGEIYAFHNLQEGCTSNSAHMSNPIIDGYSMYTKEVKEQTKKSELGEYLDDKLVDIDDASFNLLGWWKDNRLRYPGLSRMAQDVLAIPTCVYSMKGNISSDLRETLEGVSPQLVEAVICSKDWILSDLQSIPESPN